MVLDPKRAGYARRAVVAVTVLASGVATLAVAALPATAAPTFTGLGDLPGGEHKSIPARVSADGSTVVGYSDSILGEEPFRWTWSGGLQGLGVLPREPQTAINSNAVGVNTDGSVVVGYSHTRGFRWTEAEGLVNISDLGGGVLLDFPRDLSDDGSTIVGRIDTGSGYAYARVAGGGVTELIESSHPSATSMAVDAISGDGSTVVGQLGTGSDPTIDPYRMFRWTAEDGMVASEDLPGSLFATGANDVSADGSVVVGAGWNGSSTRPLVWREGEAVELLIGPTGFPPIGSAFGVSADGSVIVGNAGFAGSAALRAFVWDESNGMRQLETVLAALGVDTTGWELNHAVSVSADGRTIAGYGRNPNGDREAWIAIIPEPGTGLLVGAGLVGLAGRRRRPR